MYVSLSQNVCESDRWLGNLRSQRQAEKDSGEPGYSQPPKNTFDICAPIPAGEGEEGRP